MLTNTINWVIWDTLDKSCILQVYKVGFGGFLLFFLIIIKWRTEGYNSTATQDKIVKNLGVSTPSFLLTVMAPLETAEYYTLCVQVAEVITSDS